MSRSRLVRILLLSMLPGTALAQGPDEGTPPPSEASEPRQPEAAPQATPPQATPPQGPAQGAQQEGAAEVQQPAPASAPDASPPPGVPGGAGGAFFTSEQAAPAGASPAASPVVSSASEPGPVDEAPYSGPLGFHQEHWFAWLGVRNDYVRDERFDMFGTNDAFTAFSLGAGRVAISLGELSVAGVLLWETAGKEADARGDATDVRVHRFELGPELRYHLHYRFYGFARLGLGAQYSKAVLSNELTGSEWVAKDWAFSSELTGGVAVQFFGAASGETRLPRGWFVAEGGYALSGDASLRFEPSREGSRVPERAQEQDFGALSFNAPLFRLAVAGSY